MALVFLSDEMMTAVNENPEEAMLRTFFQGTFLKDVEILYMNSTMG